MEKSKIGIFIADNNTGFHDVLYDYLLSNDLGKIVGFASNGEKAAEKILKSNADVVVIEVLMPSKDGFKILKEIREKNKEIICVMVSAFAPPDIAEKAMLMGANYFMIKPLKEELFMERMYEIVLKGKGKTKERNIIKESLNSDLKVTENNRVPNKLETNEYKISSILNKLGVSPSIKGYYYVRTAIEMVVNDKESLIGITKRMYPEIGKEYSSSASKVERGIRHAIESAWKKGASNVFRDLTGFNFEEKPTNCQFIAGVAEYIRFTSK